MAWTRRLAAILAADVAGYSRLMGADEEGLSLDRYLRVSIQSFAKALVIASQQNIRRWLGGTRAKFHNHR